MSCNTCHYFVTYESCHNFGTWGGRRSPGLYADISVPVLQVPAGEEGGPGGLPNSLKEREKEGD